jgi:cytochrome c
MLNSNLYANNSAETIFNEKCSVCHHKNLPKKSDKMVAPNINGVMKHIKMKYTDKNEAIEFISDYTLNPTKDKAVCKAKKIKKFGLMPSQKDNITEEEIKKVSEWLFDNFPKKGFVGRGMKNAKNINKQKKRKKFKPFLITSGIPHLTAVININWDDEELNLTDKQKEKLLKIRKKTLMALKDLKLEIKELEDFIIKSIQDDESKKELFSMVEELGDLKVKATKIHIECVQDTKNTLTKDQVKFVMEQF